MRNRVVNRQFLQFAIAGVAGLLVDVLSLYFLLLCFNNAYLARLGAFLLAVICTWQINRRTTFAASASGNIVSNLAHEFAQYLLAMIGGGILNLLCSGLALYYFPQHILLPLFAVCIGSLAGMAFNFLAAKYWVFRRKV